LKKIRGSVWFKLPQATGSAYPSEPQQVAPLDISKLNRKEHLNWIKVGLAVREVGQMLARFIHLFAISFHAQILAEGEAQGLVKYTGGESLYREQGSPDVLKAWGALIKRHHKGNEPTWSNSGARKWCASGGFFEVVEFFCAKMGPHKQAIQKEDAASVDFCSLMAMLLWCDQFKAKDEVAVGLIAAGPNSEKKSSLLVPVACLNDGTEYTLTLAGGELTEGVKGSDLELLGENEKRRRGWIRAATNARNQWAHNPSLEFTDEAAQKLLVALCTFLEHEPNLRREDDPTMLLPEAKEALRRVKGDIIGRDFSLHPVQQEELVTALQLQKQVLEQAKMALVLELKLRTAEGAVATSREETEKLEQQVHNLDGEVHRLELRIDATKKLDSLPFPDEVGDSPYFTGQEELLLRLHTGLFDVNKAGGGADCAGGGALQCRVLAQKHRRQCMGMGASARWRRPRSSRADVGCSILVACFG
jgi:hypothetical protein